MDNIKDKYSMRFFLSTVAFVFCFICAFFAIDYSINIFFIITLVVVDVFLFYLSYQSLMYRLALREKFSNVYENKINLDEYYNKKLKTKEKITRVINRIFIYSLYASPILILLFVSVGIFLVDSVLLAIVLPAFLISYLVIIFFIKDIYSNLNYKENKEVEEIVFVNKKTITYKGETYIFNYCGFHFKGDTYKFLFIPLSKPKFDDETKKKIEELRENEICD
jgi:hypothetical protein